MSAGASSNVADITERSIERSSPWFEDGNVILQAENFQFKVHRSILAQNSLVFRDMFSLAVSDDMDGQGCPIVSLYDSPSDVSHLLNAIYDRRRVYFIRISASNAY